MKKLILLLFIPLVFNCSDDSTDNNSSSSNSYLGTYIGDIDVFLQGQYHSTLYNHAMSFISIENSNNIRHINIIFSYLTKPKQLTILQIN